MTREYNSYNHKRGLNPSQDPAVKPALGKFQFVRDLDFESGQKVVYLIQKTWDDTGKPMTYQEIRTTLGLSLGMLNHALEAVYLKYQSTMIKGKRYYHPIGTAIDKDFQDRGPVPSLEKRGKHLGSQDKELLYLKRQQIYMRICTIVGNSAKPITQKEIRTEIEKNYGEKIPESTLQFRLTELIEAGKLTRTQKGSAFHYRSVISVDNHKNL